jgi:hypothetical protein
VLDLARQLGLRDGPIPRPVLQAPRVPDPPPGLNVEHWQAVWPEIVSAARAQRERLEDVRDLNAIADWLRRRYQYAAMARRIASHRGDCASSWRLLQTAARVETTAREIESLLDEVWRHAT